MWYYLPDYTAWYNWWYNIEEQKYGIDEIKEEIKEETLLPNPIEEIKPKKGRKY
jgi:hypothetical protein